MEATDLYTAILICGIAALVFTGLTAIYTFKLNLLNLSGAKASSDALNNKFTDVRSLKSSF